MTKEKTPQLQNEPTAATHHAVQRRAKNQGEQTAVPGIVHDVLQTPGQSLDTTTRAALEPRFGHDFSQVQVHTDEKSAESAQSINAKAYTVGSHIVFAPGRYAPQTLAGANLLVHELTHVVQQAGNENLSEDLTIGQNNTSAEQEARSIAATGQPLGVLSVQQTTPVQIARDSFEDEVRKQLGAPPAPSPGIIWMGPKPSAELQKAAEIASSDMAKGQKVDVTPHYAPGQLELGQKLVEQGVLEHKPAPAPRPQDTPLSQLLPPPRTKFEAFAQKARLKTVRHPETGATIGYLQWDAGILHLKDIEGNSVHQLAEKGLETPFIDPIDVIPFELVASLAVKAAMFTGRTALKMGRGAVGKVITRDVGTEALENLTKTAVSDLATAAEGKSLTSQAPKGPEVFQELGGELGLTTSQQPIRNVGEAVGMAQTQGLMKGIEPGVTDLAVQSHASSKIVKQSLGLPGSVESAHLLPSAVTKGMPSYSRGKALTTLLPHETHTALDNHWKNWAKALRRGGQTDDSAFEFYQEMTKAIRNAPNLSDATKGALEWRLHQEMFKDLSLKYTDRITLPYPNIKPSP